MAKLIAISCDKSNVWGCDDGTLELSSYTIEGSSGIESPQFLYLIDDSDFPSVTPSTNPMIFIAEGDNLRPLLVPDGVLVKTMGEYFPILKTTDNSLYPNIPPFSDEELVHYIKQHNEKTEEENRAYRIDTSSFQHLMVSYSLNDIKLALGKIGLGGRFEVLKEELLKK